MSENLTWTSWGRVFRYQHRQVKALHWRHEANLLSDVMRPMLAYGMGRSYGDCCLNENASLVLTRGLNRLISFDRDQGLLACEAGITLGELLEVLVPEGWFIPVTPGTQFVTVGGAIANDVHGKNHHLAGTFGNFVESFELLRSSGERLRCSAQENPELFAATIGGLGLTGLIVSCVLRVKRAAARLAVESIRFAGLPEFMSIANESDVNWEYTVAWIDCVNAWGKWGRGIFMRGNHVNQSVSEVRTKRTLAVPFEAPSWLLNRFSVKAFNELYYRRLRRQISHDEVDYQPFFYPLDSIRQWNLIYGKRGFYQFQFVIALSETEALRDIFERIALSGHASFLAVLKKFGPVGSPGLLSFPREGFTLTLDFSNQGADSKKLFDDLVHIVRLAGGCLYPAKDACMSPIEYEEFYPQTKDFLRYIDPGFSSSFWRRVGKAAT